MTFSDIQKLFIDNAKTYVQLSSGALVLSIAFIHDVLGVRRDQPIPRDWWLVASWVFFLLSIMAGSFYQYSLAKHYQGQTIVAVGVPFQMMLVSFHLGALYFVVTAFRRVTSLK